MAFESDLEDLFHDVRLVRHHMRRNTLEVKDHDKYLDGLPDVAEHADETETRFARVWNSEATEA